MSLQQRITELILSNKGADSVLEFMNLIEKKFNFSLEVVHELQVKASTFSINGNFDENPEDVLCEDPTSMCVYYCESNQGAALAEISTKLKSECLEDFVSSGSAHGRYFGDVCGTRFFNKYACGDCEGEARIACVICNMYGKVDCRVCYASGVVTCDGCNGSGRKHCFSCSGSGVRVENRTEMKTVSEYNAYTKMYETRSIPENVRYETSCWTCNGKGNTDCSPCYGRGEISCWECRGLRQIDCRDCGGSRFFRCEHCEGTGVDGVLSCPVMEHGLFGKFSLESVRDGLYDTLIKEKGLDFAIRLSKDIQTVSLNEIRLAEDTTSRVAIKNVLSGSFSLYYVYFKVDGISYTLASYDQLSGLIGVEDFLSNMLSEDLQIFKSKISEFESSSFFRKNWKRLGDEVKRFIRSDKNRSFVNQSIKNISLEPGADWSKNHKYGYSESSFAYYKDSVEALSKSIELISNLMPYSFIGKFLAFCVASGILAYCFTNLLIAGIVFSFFVLVGPFFYWSRRKLYFQKLFGKSYVESSYFESFKLKEGEFIDSGMISILLVLAIGVLAVNFYSFSKGYDQIKGPFLHISKPEAQIESAINKAGSKQSNNKKNIKAENLNKK